MTPCPDLDRLFDAAAAGTPGAAERLDAHVASCPACAAEALLADEPDAFVDDALACLRGVECPPDVVSAALAAARPAVFAAPRHDRALERSADRGPTAPPRRTAWRWVGASALAVVAVIAALTQFQAGPAAPQGQLASRQTERAGEPPVTPAARPEPTPTETITSAPTPDLPTPAPPPTPRPAPPRPSTPERLVPDPAIQTPDLVAEAPPVPPSPDVSLTPADSVAARDGLALAFAIVGRAQQSADAAVSTELQRVSTALQPTRLL